MSNNKTDVVHPIGYKTGEQQIDKSDTNSSGSNLPPQAGTYGQPDSHISGQGGPEILGGSASTRILGQSVDAQLNTMLPPKNDNK
ncbi:unnamed protein product [Adineta steineri]|uniref:Uncharacterized protein n=1 Tax=Adineta steineri TaxID=433720 RepID=A0A819Q4T5_9BILA|nr:unnamed protein product [Adineta steineri]CAF4018605.1 unnamed protein product [Adineta steineri]